MELRNLGKCLTKESEGMSTWRHRVHRYNKAIDTILNDANKTLNKYKCVYFQYCANKWVFLTTSFSDFRRFFDPLDLCQLLTNLKSLPTTQKLKHVIILLYFRNIYIGHNWQCFGIMKTYYIKPEMFTKLAESKSIICKIQCNT